MNLRPIDEWYLHKEEPVKSCLQFLRSEILGYSTNVTESWRYSMPFFFYRDKRFCYLWIDKKSGWPYLGIVDGHKIDHPGLIAGNRARMKILLIDPTKDIATGRMRALLRKVLALYQ